MIRLDAADVAADVDMHRQGYLHRVDGHGVLRPLRAPVRLRHGHIQTAVGRLPQFANETADGGDPCALYHIGDGVVNRVAGAVPLVGGGKGVPAVLAQVEQDMVPFHDVLGGIAPQAHQSPCAEDQQHYGCRRTQQPPLHDAASVAGTSAVLLARSSPSMNSCIRVQ